MDEAAAHRAGALLGKARTNDVVDASVVTLAVDREADIATGDVHDLRRLVALTRTKIAIFGV